MSGIPRWRHWRVVIRAFLYHLRQPARSRYCTAPAEPDDPIAWHFACDDALHCSNYIGRLRWAWTGRCRQHRTYAR